MDSVTDICKYHFLCFVTIIQVKVISGHQVKNSNKTNRDLELRYMFLSQIFAKNAKNGPNTLFETSKSVKKQNSEIHGKVPNDVKNASFWYVLRYISAILKISTWNFVHIFMRHCPLTYVTFLLLKILIWGKLSQKEKNGHFLKFFEIFNIWKSEIAVL